MDLLLGYCGEEDKRESEENEKSLGISLNATPNVRAATPPRDLQLGSSSVVHHNPKWEDLQTPISGPHKPFSQNKGMGGKNLSIGSSEAHSMDGYFFESRYHQYQSHLYGNSSAEKKRKREAGGDVTSNPTEYKGPWADYEGEKKEEEKKTDLSKEELEKVREASSTLKKLKEVDEKEKVVEEERAKEMSTSVFHGEQFRDYLGRTFISPPSELKPKEHSCFAPKKAIHTWCSPPFLLLIFPYAYI